MSRNGQSRPHYKTTR